MAKLNEQDFKRSLTSEHFSSVYLIYGEEKYLESLYRRAEKHTNPAKTMLTELRSGSSLETLIRKYA